GRADRGMGDIAVTRDLVGGVDDDHALVHVVGEHARGLAQHGRLAHAGLAQQEDALSALYQVVDDGDGAVHGTADAAGEADDGAATVADAGDAVQRALDAGAIVVAELADVGDDVIEVGLGHFDVAEHHLPAGIARLRKAAQIHDDLEQFAAVRAVQ